MRFNPMMRLLLGVLVGAGVVTATPARAEQTAAADAPKPAEGQPTEAPKADGKPAEAQPAAEVEKNDGEKKEEKVSAGSAVLTPEQLAKLSGFFFSASIDHTMGIGTFVDPTKYAYLAANVNAFVLYRTQIKGRAVALGLQPFGLNGLFYEYTLPDSPTGQRFQYSDARIALSMPALIKESFTGIVMTPSFNVIIPTTPESWAAGLISRVGLGASLNKNFTTPIGKLIISAGGIGTLGIYRNPGKVVYRSDKKDAQGHSVVLCGARDGATCDNYGNNSFIAVQASTSVTVAPTDRLGVSISYGLQPYWNYAATNSIDDATPKAVDSNGNPVAQTGMAAGIPRQSASVSFSFNITDAVSASVYVWNWGPIYSLDMKRWRFPFWDTEGPANNYTYLGFSLGATY